MSQPQHFDIESARRISETLEIDWNKRDFDLEQFRMGLDVELEHGSHFPATDITHDDSVLIGKIVLAHLNEFPDYYTRLAKMEEGAKRYHSVKAQTSGPNGRAKADYLALTTSLHDTLEDLELTAEAISDRGETNWREARTELEQLNTAMQRCLDRLTSKLKSASV